MLIKLPESAEDQEGKCVWGRKEVYSFTSSHAGAATVNLKLIFWFSEACLSEESHIAGLAPGPAKA